MAAPRSVFACDPDRSRGRLFVEPPSKVRPDLAIPPELELVVMNALAKKREQRYQTMGQLLEALEKVHTIVGQSISCTTSARGESERVTAASCMLFGGSWRRHSRASRV